MTEEQKWKEIEDRLFGIDEDLPVQKSDNKLNFTCFFEFSNWFQIHNDTKLADEMEITINRIKYNSPLKVFEAYEEYSL